MITVIHTTSQISKVYLIRVPCLVRTRVESVDRKGKRHYTEKVGEKTREYQTNFSFTGF